LFSGILDVYDVAPAMLRRCLFGHEKKKELLELFRANWRNSMQVDRTSDARGCGRRWTLGTAMDRRRLVRTAVALLDGSA
jgi:hypothetical protein